MARLSSPLPLLPLPGQARRPRVLQTRCLRTLLRSHAAVLHFAVPVARPKSQCFQTLSYCDTMEVNGMSVFVFWKEDLPVRIAKLENFPSSSPYFVSSRSSGGGKPMVSAMITLSSVYCPSTSTKQFSVNNPAEFCYIFEK